MTIKTKGGIDVPADLASALAVDAEVLAMWQRLRGSPGRLLNVQIAHRDRQTL